MRAIGGILIFIGVITAFAAGPAFAAYAYRRIPGFRLGVLIGSPIWIISAVYLGYLGGGIGEAVVGTEIGVPIGLFIGMIGGSVAGVLVSGLVGSLVSRFIH